MEVFEPKESEWWHEQVAVHTRVAHCVASFPAQFSTLSPKFRTLCVSAFLFPYQPGAHIGHQSPSRVQPSANKVHLTHPHSSSTLTCSPRDTEFMGVRSHHCWTIGLHPCPPQAPGTTSVGSGFAQRGSTRLRQGSEDLAGTKK